MVWYVNLYSQRGNGERQSICCSYFLNKQSQCQASSKQPGTATDLRRTRNGWIDGYRWNRNIITGRPAKGKCLSLTPPYHRPSFSNRMSIPRMIINLATHSPGLSSSRRTIHPFDLERIYPPLAALPVLSYASAGLRGYLQVHRFWKLYTQLVGLLYTGCLIKVKVINKPWTYNFTTLLHCITPPPNYARERKERAIICG